MEYIHMVIFSNIVQFEMLSSSLIVTKMCLFCFHRERSFLHFVPEFALYGNIRCFIFNLLLYSLISIVSD